MRLEKTWYSEDQAMSYQAIIFEKENNTALIMLSRPDSLDALSFELARYLDKEMILLGDLINVEEAYCRA